MKQVIAITGASTRLGALGAQELAKAGHIVYAAGNDGPGRKGSQAKAMRRFAVRNNVALHTIRLDGASESSVQTAIQRIVKECGRLDVLIHIAGPDAFGIAGNCEPERLAELYDTYVLTAQRVNRATLPAFRNQGHGLVIWVAGSQLHEDKARGLGQYLAAKAALDALAAADSSGLERWNVESTILLPGVMDHASAIVAVVELPRGTRPLLVHLDDTQARQETAMDSTSRTRSSGFRNMRLSDLLHTHMPQVIDMYS